MKYLLYLLVIVSTIGCTDDDDVSKPVDLCSDLNCDKCVLIDRDAFNETETNNYLFEEIRIDGDCLKIKYSGSGCNGRSFEEDLIDSGSIAETATEQRNLKFKLMENENCEALITKEVSFDLTPLQTKDSKILLNIEKWEDSILYEY